MIIRSISSHSIQIDLRENQARNSYKQPPIQISHNKNGIDKYHGTIGNHIENITKPSLIRQLTSFIDDKHESRLNISEK